MITTEIIRDIDTFRDMRNEWKELLQASSCNCLFLSWEWMYTWWVHLSEKRKLHIITVREDELLIAIAPLALCPSHYKKLMPFRVLEFLASGKVGSDYRSFMIRSGHEEQALVKIAQCLTESNLILELERVEKSSYSMVNLVLQLKQFDWPSISKTTNYSPYIKLTGHTWESYLDSLSNRHRANVNKKIKNLHRAFEVKFVKAETEEQRELAMETFISLHLARWSTEGGSDALDQEEVLDFHKDISRVFFEQDCLCMYTLLLDGVAAATVYIFRYENIYYYYQAAFDTQFWKYGVGVIILAMSIKAAIEEGVIEFDFLHDDEEYKYLWAREERELIRLDLYPPKNIGKAYKHAVIVKSRIKQALSNFSSTYQ